MKTTILIPVIMAIFITGQGQTSSGTNNSGTVKYEEKMKLNINMEGQPEGVADMLPKERTVQNLLYFTPDASLYLSDNTKNNTDDVDRESGGAKIHIEVDASNDKIYRDLKENKKIEQRDFMTRLFLIESDAGKADWKLTGEQKTILDYPCQEATREQDGKTIRAWFTPAIPVSTGPQNFGNLPGLILGVDIDNGNRTITASSVSFAPVDKSVLVKPKGGKKVTPEEFKKIVDEKMKEMGAEGGNGQQIIIRVQK